MKWLFAMVAGLVLAAGVSAQEMSPDALIKSVTSDVLDIVRKDKDIQSGNTKKAIELVEAKVLPYFNFTHMTKLALARDWRNTTPAQQKILTDEFHALLVRTYSKALTEYKNQTIDYKPFKMQPGDTDVKVRTEIKQPGGKPIQLDYYLEKQERDWKVYDIEVGGISLILNYRESFANEVRQSGIDGLIQSLQAKNKSGEAASVKK
ncbi:MAG: ABC transporter substrate-binding protein [Sulfuritalea sp.]|jgi:phospholipid transport system substrate-binding protein|nr:ABC transporter substrate-binding protein [Sulfuritalea sp.]